jgi:large subunit ribosomal protein L25
MARKELMLEPRQVTGKKVVQLRRAGIVPANVFGRRLDSVTVQVDAVELLKTIRSSTKNEVIDLTVSGEKASRPGIIQHIQRNPLTGAILHADFYQVSLREKMRADVRLVLVGSSDAVVTFSGVLTQQTDTIHIEALPLDIPTHIEVDISALAELDSSIHVSDLPIPANVLVLTAGEVVVAHVASPAKAEEVEEVAPTEAAAAAAQEAEAEEST